MIIYNSILPFAGYKLINICGLIFARKKANVTEVDINHEKIHTKQILELLIIGFYICYVLEWIYRTVFHKYEKSAYKEISFEKEAYANERNLNYLKERKHYAMWK